MAERFLKVLVALLSRPVVALAWAAETWNIWGIRSDIRRCLDSIDSARSAVPTAFLKCLVAAEDHRNAFHLGIDPIAMLRAIYVRLLLGHIQGASTIEQQFVRVISGRYEKTLARKVYEQMLAVAVSRRRSKHQIATAYLSVAFYGSARIGLAGLRTRLGNNLSLAKQNDIRGMIARLKYPEPLKPTSAWQQKIRRRIEYICLREDRMSSSNYQSVSSDTNGTERRLGVGKGTVAHRIQTTQ